MLLAEAGLLDGRTAAISKGLQAVFRQRYPAVEIDASGEITMQDRIYCASMPGLGTRLSLLLMSRFLPSDISNLLNKSVSGKGLRDVLPSRVLPPGDTESALDVNDQLVSQAQYWFQKNISEKVTLADAANSMLVSEKTLARHFRKTLGITPHTYLQRIRMDSAKGMLLHSDLSVEIIAERVGYRDQSFFERIFRRHVGLTPSKYRKSLGRAP
jgi:transcriptional regulator GlxA family with amidase domain